MQSISYFKDRDLVCPYNQMTLKKRVDLFLEKVDIGQNFFQPVSIFSTSSAPTTEFCLFNTADKDLDGVAVTSEVLIYLSLV